MNRRTRGRLLRAFAATAATLTALTLVIGFAHTPKGRFLLAYLPGMGAACPMGEVSPEQVDRARASGLARVRGDVRATTRPALGFTLESTRRADVDAWAARHGVTCASPSAQVTTCAAVPSTALEGAEHAVDQLHLAFDASGRLVGVEAMRRGMSFADAVALVDARLASVARASGGAGDRSGSTDGAHLGGGVARRARAELRYADFRAVVTAMNQGGEHPVVRERYQSITN